VPIVLPPAVFDDTIEAADHLVRVPGVLVFVDGYNVTHAARPDDGIAEQRRWLIDAVGGLTARTGGEVHVVFDGAEDGSAPAVGPRRNGVHVRFTAAGVEADDDVLALVDGTPMRRPVVVVSSDNRVAVGARALGANTIASATFAALLRR
jgi:predicted RNA-binding protein with PIN domain